MPKVNGRCKWSHSQIIPIGKVRLISDKTDKSEKLLLIFKLEIRVLSLDLHDIIELAGRAVKTCAKTCFIGQKLHI